MNHLLQLIKSKILYIILIMLITTLTLLLLIKEDKEVIIISRDYPYSIYHSDNYETIDIELLSNDPSSYHFDKEYIISTKLYNETQELSVDINEIRKSNYELQYNEQSFYQLIFELELPFTSNDYTIQMEEVYLEIVYENMEKVNIKIGEINYLFNESITSAITLSNLSATHEEINGYNTIGGVNLELSNNSNHNIIITDIKLLSNSVYINEEAIMTSQTCEYQTTVKDCLGVTYYDFHQEYNNVVLNTLLGKNNTIELYLPLIYQEDTHFIYEFSIIIEYKIDNKKEKLVIDNFPYMKTSIFSTFNEDDFNVYKITHSN